jgi:phenylalanyl-tRNA synthetase alpha chain
MSKIPLQDDVVLRLVDQNNGIEDVHTLANSQGWNPAELLAVLQRLQGFGLISIHNKKDIERFQLTEEGRTVADQGSPEVKCFNLIPSEGIDKTELDKQLGSIAKIAWTNCMKQKWVKLENKKVFRVVSKEFFIDIFFYQTYLVQLFIDFFFNV